MATGQAKSGAVGISLPPGVGNRKQEKPMKYALMLLSIIVLAGCSSTANDASSLFDRLEFKEGQEGCIRASGQVSVGGNPFASSSINVSMVKRQGESAPDC
jgi:hypothetical protein